LRAFIRPPTSGPGTTLRQGGLALCLAVCLVNLSSVAASDTPELLEPVSADEYILTVVGTNDIHGGFRPSRGGKDRRLLGGFDWFAGVLSVLRNHLQSAVGHPGRLILLDAGDGAQGSLLSNYSEGLLMVDLMNQLGYTAAVLGNHGFDFGPLGWLEDKPAPPRTSDDPLEAVRRCVRSARFPFLGLNVSTKDGALLPELPAYVCVPGIAAERSRSSASNAAGLRQPLPRKMEDIWISHRGRNRSSRSSRSWTASEPPMCFSW